MTRDELKRRYEALATYWMVFADSMMNRLDPPQVLLADMERLRRQTDDVLSAQLARDTPRAQICDCCAMSRPTMTMYIRLDDSPNREPAEVCEECHARGEPTP